MESDANTLCCLYIRGECTRPNCRFVHPADRDEALAEYARKQCLRICKYHRPGSICLQGEKCEFLHLKVAKPQRVVSPAVRKASRLRAKTHYLGYRKDAEARQMLDTISRQIDDMCRQADSILEHPPDTEIVLGD